MFGTRLDGVKVRFSFLDPAIGTGSFYAAFLQAFPRDRIESATGIELDKPFAEAAKAIWERLGLQCYPSRFYQAETRRPIQHHIDQSAVCSASSFERRRQTTIGRFGTRDNRHKVERASGPVLLFPSCRPCLACGQRASRCG